VIPTRAGWRHLSTALPPLLTALGEDDEVVAVGDGCEPGVPAGLDGRCRSVVHSGTPGFAPACNRGAAAARGRLQLLLNDDVAGAPGRRDLLGRARSPPGVGAGGPDVISEALGRSESGTSLAWRHGVLEAGQRPLEGSGCVPVPYLCGAALAVRRADFERLGGFDERLAPFFWEDADLSLRLQRNVGATVVVSGATVRHRHGATVGAVPEATRRAVYERNRWLVTWRHLEGARWLAHLAWLPLRLVSSVLSDRAALAGLVAALGVLRSRRRGDARRS